jgi:hypothetical protein
VKDLSHLADGSMTVTSQHAGNLTVDNSGAMTAPGSPSLSVPQGDVQPAPEIRPAATVPVGG